MIFQYVTVARPQAHPGPSVIAGVTGIQTFVNFSERRQNHHLAATEFQKARRLLQEIECLHKNESELTTGIREVRLLWYEALKSAPNLPSHIHDKARKKIYSDDA